MYEIETWITKPEILLKTTEHALKYALDAARHHLNNYISSDELANPPGFYNPIKFADQMDEIEAAHTNFMLAHGQSEGGWLCKDMNSPAMIRNLLLMTYDLGMFAKNCNSQWLLDIVTDASQELVKLPEWIPGVDPVEYVKMHMQAVAPIVSLLSVPQVIWYCYRANIHWNTTVFYHDVTTPDGMEIVQIPFKK